jgi:hypothetical protein
MVPNEGKWKMVSGVHYDFVHGIYQGFLYLQNATPFHGTLVILTPLNSMRKTRASLSLIRSKFLCNQQNCMQTSCTKFSLNRAINWGVGDKNLFTLLREVCTALYQ